MVDALVSGASVERRASSILVVGTKKTSVTDVCDHIQERVTEWRGGGMVDALL